jgi:hypothetical protein
VEEKPVEKVRYCRVPEDTREVMARCIGYTDGHRRLGTPLGPEVTGENVTVALNSNEGLVHRIICHLFAAPATLRSTA